MFKIFSIVTVALILGMTANHAELNLDGRTLASVDAEGEPETNAHSDPSYLAEYDYRLTDVGGKEQVDELYSILTNDLENNPNNVCHSRAYMWAYQMKFLKNVQSGKVLMIFGSGEGGAFGANGTKWWFHIAPYVISEGKEIVMEKMFSLQSPTPLGEWENFISGGKKCKVLDGSEKVVYEYFNGLFNTSRFRKSRGRSVPMSVGGYPCYIRKMPMGYLAPWTAYQHDILGQNISNDLNMGLVRASCTSSMVGNKFKYRKRLCEEFIKNPVDPIANF